MPFNIIVVIWSDLLGSVLTGQDALPWYWKPPSSCCCAIWKEINQANPLSTKAVS